MTRLTLGLMVGVTQGVSWGNRDCGFRMTPDAGGCEIFHSSTFSARDENGAPVGGAGHGHRWMSCGQRFDVCGGVLVCSCPADAG